MSSSVPEDLKYTQTHEWVRFNGSKAVVGITDHAQHELTDIVFVEPPKTGKIFEAGNVAAVVESVKVASDIYAPVSGTVTSVNTELEKNPGLINSDPYGKGWIFELETTDTGENLLDAASYGKLV
ncbi:MAG: glycine cleavage system protein GcvH [Candidatus Aureabacteria bacterium]|nr:glycine cleavage system protein GcvH [Candidatus Auribacterota bacterium]